MIRHSSTLLPLLSFVALSACAITSQTAVAAIKPICYSLDLELQMDEEDAPALAKAIAKVSRQAGPETSFELQAINPDVPRIAFSRSGSTLSVSTTFRKRSNEAPASVRLAAKSVADKTYREFTLLEFFLNGEPDQCIRTRDQLLSICLLNASTEDSAIEITWRGSACRI